MKCIKRHPAEAIRISTDNWTEVACLVEEYKEKMRMENRGKMKCSTLPFDGYIVLDGGTTEYLTKEEFNEMYKPLE